LAGRAANEEVELSRSQAGFREHAPGGDLADVALDEWSLGEVSAVGTCRRRVPVTREEHIVAGGFDPEGDSAGTAEEVDCSKAAHEEFLARL
jgi:hypothetical protein